MDSRTKQEVVVVWKPDHMAMSDGLGYVVDCGIRVNGESVRLVRFPMTKVGIRLAYRSIDREILDYIHGRKKVAT